jgi:pyrroline-5-carboxylate reductase
MELIMETITIVGMGTMGSAIESLLKENYDVIGLGRSDSLEQIENTDAVILAVKPQPFGELAKTLRPYVRHQLFISIMAGVKLRALSKALGTRRVVRTMPNLALATGNSLTAWHTEDEDTDTRAVRALLDSWGVSMRLDNEEQFNAFTALAGSGPAYFYELARLLEQEALGHGFDAGQARQIATQTFIGAASVINGQTSFARQVKSVASRGGTTEAALTILEGRQLGKTVHEAIGAACRRSEELGRC